MNTMSKGGERLVVWSLVALIFGCVWAYLKTQTPRGFDEVLLTLAMVFLGLGYIWVKVGPWVLKQLTDVSKLKTQRHKERNSMLSATIKEMRLEALNPMMELEDEPMTLTDVIDEWGCILVRGRRGSGKTNTLFRLIQEGDYDEVVGLDPHNGKSDFPLPTNEVYGTGANYTEIEQVMRHGIKLVRDRMAEPGVYSGPRRVYVVDEYRSLVKNVPSATEFMDVIATEGRKVGVDAVFASHTTSVKALGIEGDGGLRENFADVHCVKTQGSYSAVVSDGEKEWEVQPLKRFNGRYFHTNPYQVIPLGVLQEAQEVNAILNDGFVPTNINKPVKPQRKTQADEYRVKIVRMAASGVSIAEIKREHFPTMNGQPKQELEGLNATGFIEKTLSDFGFELEAKGRTKVVV